MDGTEGGADKSGGGARTPLCTTFSLILRSDTMDVSSEHVHRLADTTYRVSRVNYLTVPWRR